MLVKFVIRKFPKKIDFSKKPYVFSQILEAEGDCYQPPPPPPKKFIKDMVHSSHILCNFSINGNFEIRKFFRQHSN